MKYEIKIKFRNGEVTEFVAVSWTSSNDRAFCVVIEGPERYSGVVFDWKRIEELSIKPIL